MNPIKNAQNMVTEIDQAELAVRLIEIGCHMKRPPGTSGPEAWKSFRDAAESGTVPAYIVDDFYAMAGASIEYFRERVDALKKPTETLNRTEA